MSLKIRKLDDETPGPDTTLEAVAAVEVEFEIAVGNFSCSREL